MSEPEEDQNQIPGGPAITPEKTEKGDINSDVVSPQNQPPIESTPETPSGPQEESSENPLAEQTKEYVKDKAKEQVEKRVVQIAKEWAKKQLAAAAAWIVSALGGWEVAVIILAILLLIGIVGIAIAGVSKAYSGAYGRSTFDGIGVSATSTEAPSYLDAYELRELLGMRLIIDNDPKRFYFSQADPAFNKEPLQGKWPSGNNMLKKAGCALTSLTMIMRYYGANNITPVDVANYWASQNGGDLSLSGNMGGTLNHFMQINSLPTRQAKRVEGYPSVDTIKQYIANGIPILTQGDTMCGSSGQHWVVIIGISSDNKSIVISDPAGANWKGRGSPARFCSFSNAHILSYTVYE